MCRTSGECGLDRHRRGEVGEVELMREVKLKLALPVMREVKLKLKKIGQTRVPRLRELERKVEACR